MTVLLVLLTFVTFLLIDHFHSRKQVVLQPVLQAAKREAPPRLAPSLVGGFRFRKGCASIPATRGR
jgi:hypothetical protein